MRTVALDRPTSVRDIAQATLEVGLKGFADIQPMQGVLKTPQRVTTTKVTPRHGPITQTSGIATPASSP